MLYRSIVICSVALFCAVGCSEPPPAACDPACAEAACGDDGCGGTCGACGAGEVCNAGICASETCGNGVLDDGETCDVSAGIGCATASGCEPLGGCFSASYSGAPESCDALCETTQISECIDGDGCCAPACNPGNDRDCVPENCGNGVLDPGETCDEPDFACITEAECQPTDACDLATLIGYDFTCVVACQHATIEACQMVADGCCPANCDYTTDPDCPAPVCGNGEVEAGERCDTAIADGEGACPASCDDNRACTTDLQLGSECTTACSHARQAACTPGDGCCPPSCTSANDADCDAVQCGDGVVDGVEGCDNAIAAGEPGACPVSVDDCDDGDPCTTDTLEGVAADCSARCVNAAIACSDGDGCCPFACSANEDAECSDLALCDTMCFRALNYCVGENELFASTDACQAACRDIMTGRPADEDTDSVYCRVHHLAEALDDPETHCAHADVTPAEGCIN